MSTASPAGVARVVVAAGLLALVVGVAVVALLPAPRAIESTARSFEAALVVPADARACETAVDVPARAGQVELVVSTAGKPGGPLGIEVRDDGRVVASGRHPGGYRDEPVSVRFLEQRQRVRDAEVCVENGGNARIALLGANLSRPSPTQGWIDELGAPAGPPARIVGRPRKPDELNARIHFGWQFARDQGKLSFAGTIAERFGLAKASFLGSGAMWAALALTLAASLAALALIVREARSA